MDFDVTLQKLASARAQYETMRRAGAPPAALVDAQVGLLYLRAEMARVRKARR
jgi:hypothetical protein